MDHDTILRLLGYLLDAAFTFAPVALLAAVTWRVTR
jgi:hypothetical protein